MNLYQMCKEREKLLPEAKVRNYVFQILQGLAYMHKHGFFHRDMKPENLLVTRETVKVSVAGGQGRAGQGGVARSPRTCSARARRPSGRWRGVRPALTHRPPSAHPPLPPIAACCCLRRWPTLGWRARCARGRPTRTTCPRAGTARPRCCCARLPTRRPSTCGRWARSWPSCSRCDRSSPDPQRWDARRTRTRRSRPAQCASRLLAPSPACPCLRLCRVQADEIYKIASVLGTPTAASWPQGLQLARSLNFKWPQFAPTPLSVLIPNGSPEAIQLMQVRRSGRQRTRPGVGWARPPSPRSHPLSAPSPLHPHRRTCSSTTRPSGPPLCRRCSTPSSR